MARVVVVDDSPTERQFLYKALVAGGHHVVVAESAAQAIEIVRQQKPDLVLMDIVMPEMNGFQATRALQRYPETRGIPIIMISTKDKESDRHWAMRQGAKDYIVKPVRQSDLLSVVHVRLNLPGKPDYT